MDPLADVVKISRKCFTQGLCTHRLGRACHSSTGYRWGSRIRSGMDNPCSWTSPVGTSILPGTSCTRSSQFHPHKYRYHTVSGRYLRYRQGSSYPVGRYHRNPTAGRRNKYRWRYTSNLDRSALLGRFRKHTSIQVSNRLQTHP